MRVQYQALLREYGSWYDVPAYEKEVVRYATGFSAEEEEAVLIGLGAVADKAAAGLPAVPSARCGVQQRMPHTMKRQTASASPRAPARPATGGPASPRRPIAEVESKLRAYIRRPVISAITGVAADGSPPDSPRSRRTHDPLLVVRALQEMRLRVPPFRRQVQAHGGDLSSEAVQAACYEDVFRLMDDTGEGCVTLEQVESFGRKVGPITARLLSRETFANVVADSLAERGGGMPQAADGPSRARAAGAVARDDFMAALFPDRAARRAAEAARARELALTARADAAGRWDAGWHPEDLVRFKRILKLCGCDIDRGGATFATVSAARIKKLCASDPSAESKRYSLDSILSRFDADSDGQLTVSEAAALFKPAFDASRRSEDTEPILYFKDVKAPW